jgi:hypothetical protein
VLPNDITLWEMDGILLQIGLLQHWEWQVQVKYSCLYFMYRVFTSCDCVLLMISTMFFAGTFWRNSSSSSGLLVLNPSACPRRNALSRALLVHPHQWSAVPLWEMARWKSPTIFHKTGLIIQCYKHSLNFNQENRY